MSERERWIVYPLLFLALGASLRDKLFDQTMSRRIVCQELIVAEDDRGGREPMRVLARIGATEPTATGRPIGNVFVDGQVVVKGTINANNYSMRGIPFGPALRAVLPGVSPADLLRALQESAAALQNSRAPTGAEQPPRGAGEPSVPQPVPPTDGETQPAE
jgi:hypothetical protein